VNLSTPPTPYREYRPAADLAPYVECFWTRLDAGGEPLRQRVLPDGCVDILFDVGAWRRGERSEPYGFVVGTMTAAQVVEARGPTHLVAARFRPGGAHPFLRRPMRELTDREVALSELWPADGALAEGLAAAGDDPRPQVRLLAARLRAELPRLAPGDSRVRAAVELLVRSGGRARVEAVGRRLEVSRQVLARRFHEVVGVGPKRLARVVRLRRLLGLAGAGVASGEAGGAAADPWAGLAVDAGYYDQPHMIAEVKALTGLTPTELVAGL
jgi:AraC-like DNA-binding protein